MKTLKILLALSFLNLMALFFITLGLPERVPTHANSNMVIDGYGSKWTVFIFGLLPIIIALGMLIFRHVMNKKKIITKNQKVENIIFPLITAFMIISTWLPVSLATQYNLSLGERINIPLDLIIIMPIGILLILISNYFGVIKQNHWLGIRTPWTLSSQTVWTKTHRLGGFTGVIGGFIICLFCALGFIFKTPTLSFIGVAIGIILLAIVPTIYSYILYKKEKKW